LHYRSHIPRSNRARLAWPIRIALALICSAGCQSNAERDLAARDRRLQEDQLYAMQDYISQYQQLVCRYRSENASLKRRLDYEYDGAPVVREPQPAPRTPTTTSPRSTGPTIEIPSTPGNQKNQTPSPNLEIPDVPPLKQGASAGNDVPPEPHEVLPASYYQPINRTGAQNGEAASAAGPTNVDPSCKTNTSPNILLSGEVIANETGGGPRLVVDIEPFDQTGHATQFDGSLSLMLVASNGKGQQQKLSRWDFSADEVRTALVADTNEPTIRFHVELPPDVKVNDANELWVRLVPTTGGKMLTHAKIDLSQPGVFSSRTDKLWPSEESVVATNYEEPIAKPADVAAPDAAPVAAPMTEGTWAVAQPDKPAILPPESDRTTGGWRASSEPMPAVVRTTTPSKTVWNDRPTLPKSEPKSTPPAAVAKKPTWSAERPGGASHDARPSWSATR